VKKYRKFPIFIALIILTIISISANASPPKVIKTIPENGDQNVDPRLWQIRVEFDQNMGTKEYSVCTGTSSPKIIGKPTWINKRTVIIGVKLEPNREYELSINCQSYRNFRNLQGESAVIYPVKFKTAAAGGKSNESVKSPAVPMQEDANTVSNTEAISKLRQFIDERYSYRDLRGVNWDKLFDEYTPRLKQAKTSRDFAQAAADMLSNAEDMHLWVKINDKTINGFKRNLRRNYNLEFLVKEIPNRKDLSKYVSAGRFPNGIGYILIKSWTKNENQVLKPALRALKHLANTRALIIDVRPNGGGAEPFAQQFAGCFTDRPVVYAKHISRDVNKADGWSQIRERTLKPNPDMLTYKGKVAVLMGQENMSSCEAFLLMMKQVPDCKLIGEKSYGSSGNPKPYELGNEVTIWLPSWKALRPDETCFEGQGIEPDINIVATESQLREKDPVLEAALKYLKSNF
jgi:hypothetical protein